MVLHFVAEVFPQVQEIGDRHLRLASDGFQGVEQAALEHDGIPLFKKVLMSSVVPGITIRTDVSHVNFSAGKRGADPSDNELHVIFCLSRLIAQNVQCLHFFGRARGCA
jgi:hypothetical protein